MTTGLEVSGLTVRYGGNTAVDSVSFTAHRSAVTGLIGPNGAGKTSTFNAVSGILRPASGTVALDGEDITTLSVQARAQRGLGRTFQRMELFDSMSVIENVALGPESLLAGRRAWKQLTGGRRERAEITARAEEAVERCGIADIAERNASELSTGQRRLVELARAVASRFSFLLLDEPSSGLDVGETEQFGAILESIVRDDGTGILLVEHDMALVRLVCTYIYVLDFGELVYQGPTADVLASDIVKAAYLGTEGVEAAVG